MERDRSKAKDNHPFAFEEFITINKVDLKELPDYVQTMISTIQKQREVAREKCTTAHYKIIVQRLRRFADIVEDYLLNHFDEQLENNKLDEAEHKLPLLNESSKERLQINSIFSLSEKFERNYLLTSELKSLGINVDYSKKQILIEELRLERELATAKWYIGVNSKHKEVQL